MAWGKTSTAMAASSRSSHLTCTFSTKALQVKQQPNKGRHLKINHTCKQTSFIKKQGIIDVGNERFLKQQLMKGLLLQLSKQRARVLVQIKSLQKEVTSMETQLALKASSSSAAPAAAEGSLASTATSSVAPTATEGSSAVIEHRAEDSDMDDVMERMGLLSL